jgi:hypothetical protein
MISEIRGTCDGLDPCRGGGASAAHQRAVNVLLTAADRRNGGLSEDAGNTADQSVGR